MHIHILGICGTFMGGVALLAREMGFEVSGSDQQVYPPMSTQLEEQGIALTQGYDPASVAKQPDLYVIGNAMARGNPFVEHILNNQLPYVSGPQFIHDHVLKDKWVIAVAGTHGKTTTSSMVAQILDYAHMAPGFLIGGIPENFGISARMGETPFFVIEADEYDTAFFDKRSKFVHYSPRTAILNNLEFDHADIFENLDAIKKQFNHLLRIVPGNGLVVYPADDTNLADVLGKGCWTPSEKFSLENSQQTGWHAVLHADDGSEFDVMFGGEKLGTVRWNLLGIHNVSNALAAIAAARHAGVPVDVACEALAEFINAKRRMELRGEPRGIKIYDDFAHHPTAIQTTLDGLRRKIGNKKIIAVFEPRSNTMRKGSHIDTLPASFAPADEVVFFQPPGLSWDLHAMAKRMPQPAAVYDSVQEVIDHLKASAHQGDEIVIMSNGGFENIHRRLIEALS
ncbi:MAG: UDP-N-acetylmuramate:L-alanyl-gamma-D-glutamyl-meso-diaminopimelate ligase [Gammaproteobacteria bacterium]|nr:UDP-N-acetylmuramate:L-alanyl-gamma-D-glutamyl-meso-diaminopimelate ligase [Gammaproteobacteria bacterium]